MLVGRRNCNYYWSHGSGTSETWRKLFQSFVVPAVLPDYLGARHTINSRVCFPLNLDRVFLKQEILRRNNDTYLLRHVKLFSSCSCVLTTRYQQLRFCIVGRSDWIVHNKVGRVLKETALTWVFGPGWTFDFQNPAHYFNIDHNSSFKITLKHTRNRILYNKTGDALKVLV